MIINIRGTNGSGKSSVVRSVMGLANTARPIFGVIGPKRPEAYECRLPGLVEPLYVLGPYLSPTGGCDMVQPYARVVDLLEKYSPKGHVLFEGVIISTCWGVVGEFLEANLSAIVYLETPLDQCVKRVQTRRGNGGKEVASKLMEDKFHGIVKQRKKVVEGGKVIVRSCLPDAGATEVLALLSKTQGATV